MASQIALTNDRVSHRAGHGGFSSVRSTSFISTPLNAPSTLPTHRAGFPTAPPEARLHSHNQVLAHLSGEAVERISPHLRRVLLHQNDVLHEQGSEITHVYFVEKGMISLVVEACSDAQVETAVIGYEGMTGALSVLGNHPSFHRAIVQVPGKAYRLPVGVLQDEWKRNPRLQEWMMNYANLLMAQVSQTVLCGRIHSVEERLSRWLLGVRDRIESETLELTHDYIAQMLGVRRPSVTITIGVLQQAGLIECGRGHVTIMRPKELENRACECYGTLHRQFENFKTQIHAHA